MLAAFLVSRSCGSSEGEISRDEAVELARERASFEPCSDAKCIQVRNVPRGLPQRRYWVVGLARALDANGNPTRFESFFVDAQTGAVTRT